MEGLLRTIRLTLFDTNRLIRYLRFDTIKVQMKRPDLFQTSRGLDKHGIALQLRMAGDLKVVLLLAHERFVRV
jgi:hypothetical protein